MTLLLTYLFLALTVSFLCSLMEAVLLSSSRSFLMVKKNEGYSWADKLMGLKDNIDKPLSAILSLNTVAHTVGAAGVGAQAVVIFGEQWFGLISAILTLMILIFTEIIPKTMGANYWKKLAGPTYYILRVMIVVSYPLVVLSSLLAKVFSSKENLNSTSREEISAMAFMGASEGLFNDKEHKIIQNILRLKNVKVSDIMTPRVVLTTANENQTLNDFLRNKDYLKFSRIPVFSQTEENITGYVFRQIVFEKLADDQHSMLLSEIKRSIVVVPESMALYNVWEKLIDKKEHIALVVDEYGGVDGVVTIEDILETLLGLEIVDEKDTVTDMQKYARERWKSRQQKYDYFEK